MRHLVSISAAGLNADPRSIAGDSLGIGLAAMLTGATSYDAFDARPHASAARNPEMLECVPPARTETAPAIRLLSDEVLRTAGAYVIAVKA
jgi:hypothetical protein